MWRKKNELVSENGNCECVECRGTSLAEKKNYIYFYTSSLAMRAKVCYATTVSSNLLGNLVVVVVFARCTCVCVCVCGQKWIWVLCAAEKSLTWNHKNGFLVAQLLKLFHNEKSPQNDFCCWANVMLSLSLYSSPGRLFISPFPSLSQFIFWLFFFCSCWHNFLLNQDKRDYRTAGKMISALLSLVRSFLLHFCPSSDPTRIYPATLVKLYSDHIKSFVTIQFCLLCMFGLSNMLFRCSFVNGQSLYAPDEHMRLDHHLSLRYFFGFFFLVQFKQSHFRLFCENY